MKFADKIKEARRNKGWSVYDLAKALDLKSPGYVSRIEARGEIPGPDLVIKISEVLGLEVDAMFELASKEKGKQAQQQVERKYADALLYRKGRS